MDTAEDELVAARETYHVAIRQLAADGMSLREIAQALGMSHQRVHQIVAGTATPAQQPKRGRRSGLAAGALIAALAIASVSLAVTLEQDADDADAGRSEGPTTEELVPDLPPPRPPQDPYPRPYQPPDDRPWNEDRPLCPGGPEDLPNADCRPPLVVPLA